MKQNDLVWFALKNKNKGRLLADFWLFSNSGGLGDATKKHLFANKLSETLFPEPHQQTTVYAKLTCRIGRGQRLELNSLKLFFR